MAYRSNTDEQEWRVGSVHRNQMDISIQIRGSPGQLRELFQGSSPAYAGGTGHYGTRRSITGNYSSNSGLELREQESKSREAKMRKAERNKQCCGGCCIIFSPLVKLILCLSAVSICF